MWWELKAYSSYIIVVIVKHIVFIYIKYVISTCSVFTVHQNDSIYAVTSTLMLDMTETTIGRDQSKQPGRLLSFKN